MKKISHPNGPKAAWMPDFMLKNHIYPLKYAENKKNAASVEVDKCGVHLVVDELKGEKRRGGLTKNDTTYSFGMTIQLLRFLHFQLP